MWQYANMAIVQHGYKARVANDEKPPNRIAALREKLGMQQKELAALANVSPSALNKIENGTRGLDQQWMRRLAPHLGVTPAELLPDEDNPERLEEAERALLSRYRLASEREKDTFGKVADAMLPYKHDENQDDRNVA